MAPQKILCKRFSTKEKYHWLAVHDGAYSPYLPLSRESETVCAPLAAWIPSRIPEKPSTRGSARFPVCKQNLQLTSHQIPILTLGVPMLHNPLGFQIQHPKFLWGWLYGFPTPLSLIFWWYSWLCQDFLYCYIPSFTQKSLRSRIYCSFWQCK